jgi:malonyl-CoA/methylmalonyl-CoA synthetase
VNGNIYDLFRSHWAVALDRHFLVPGNGAPVTYREIDVRAGQFATALRDLDTRPGDRVVVQTAKSVDGVALYLGCLRMGAVYVPLNTSYTAHEVGAFLDDAAPAVFVHDVDRAVAGARTTIAIEQLSASASAAEPWAVVETRLADDLAAMVYTSGTTGRSKGAMLTHANLTSNALSLHAIWRFTPGDVLLHVLPIYHVHGLFVALHTAMLNASTVLFSERFNPMTTVELLPEATVMMGVPTHYHRLLEHADFTAELCSNMRLFTSGSAPMTEATHTTFTERTGHEILERYGMTETGMITSNPYEGDRVPGTVGFPLPAVRIRTVDPDGLPCPTGTVGVVEVQGPNVFAGYWRLPERTEAEHHDGWFVTGDMGAIDAEGRLSLEGRAGDMIISGGLNIYPKEIELALDVLDGIIESAVVGVPDVDFGEQTVGVLVVEPDFKLDPTALQGRLRETLAPFKVPKAYVVVDELPRNSMGKVQKAALRSDERLTTWSRQP